MIIKLKTKDIYIFLSRFSDAFLEGNSGQAEFFVFSLLWTCRELCLTSPYIERTYWNLRTRCAALSPRPHGFGEMQVA